MILILISALIAFEDLCPFCRIDGAKTMRPTTRTPMFTPRPPSPTGNTDNDVIGHWTLTTPRPPSPTGNTDNDVITTGPPRKPMFTTTPTPEAPTSPDYFRWCWPGGAWERNIFHHCHDVIYADGEHCVCLFGDIMFGMQHCLHQYGRAGYEYLIQKQMKVEKKRHVATGKTGDCKRCLDLERCNIDELEYYDYYDYYDH